MTGAVKLVASLAAVDGLGPNVPNTFCGGLWCEDRFNAECYNDGVRRSRLFSSRNSRKIIDLSQFGTRHGSMFRYCAQDRNALGIVVSQDGYVRLITSVRNSL